MAAHEKAVVSDGTRRRAQAAAVDCACAATDVCLRKRSPSALRKDQARTKKTFATV